MSKKSAATLALVLSAVGLLISCGGGGDVAGDSTSFAVSPDKSTLSVAAAVENDCSGAASVSWTVVSIVGGQPPFRIVNSQPSWVDVDRTEATGKDPQFRVRPTGFGCGETVISVFDYHSQLATYVYKLEAKVAE